MWSSLICDVNSVDNSCASRMEGQFHKRRILQSPRFSRPYCSEHQPLHKSNRVDIAVLVRRSFQNWTRVFEHRRGEQLSAREPLRTPYLFRATPSPCDGVSMQPP